MENEKRASDDETKKNQEHRNIATLSLQLRSYKQTPSSAHQNLENWILWVHPVSISDFVVFITLLYLDCFAEQLLFDSTLSRMSQENN